MAKTAGLVATVGLVLAGVVGPIAGSVGDIGTTDTRSPVSVTEAQIQPMFFCTWWPYLRPLCNG